MRLDFDGDYVIDLHEPLEDWRANQLRNQVAALENLIVQMSTGNQEDVPFLSLLRMEYMKRMGELTQRVMLR